MSYSFKSGDHVRVSNIAGSTWQDREGIVVDVIVRYANGPVQECAVDMNGERRWFMAAHLNRTISPRLVPLFRTEVASRWQFDPEKVAGLNGESEKLVEFLCEYSDLSLSQIRGDVAVFYMEFDRKTQQLAAGQAARVRQVHREQMGAIRAA
jgi:hypothetical protein